MSPIFGKVFGNECPRCRYEIELEGEFFEGQEIECKMCRALLCIDSVEASYDVKMGVLEEPPVIKE